jgi:hypothetical protein
MTNPPDPSGSIKATRADVQIGALTVDGFMLPDGSYRMSQTQAAESVDRPEINARRFLTSRAINALLGGGYTPDTIEIDEAQARGRGRFNALPLEVVSAYWLNQASQGNQKAYALIWALLTESLERRFDTAFGVDRTEQERNDRLIATVEQLERQLTRLGEAYGMGDEARDQLAYLNRWLEERGLDPWEIRESEHE